MITKIILIAIIVLACVVSVVNAMVHSDRGW